MEWDAGIDQYDQTGTVLNRDINVRDLPGGTVNVGALADPVGLEEERDGAGSGNRLTDVQVLVFCCTENDPFAGIKIVGRNKKLTVKTAEVVTETFVAK